MALALAMAACSQPAPEATSPAADGAAPPPEATAGDPSPFKGPTPDILRFSAPALSGGTVEGADYAGHDLAMWFWAPW